MPRPNSQEPKARLSSGVIPIGAGAWSVALRLCGALLAFFLGVQLARYLGPAGLGKYGLIMGIAMPLATLAQLGLPILATREIAISRAQGDWRKIGAILASFGLATGISGLFLGLVFAPIAWFSLRGLGLAPALLWSALIVPLAAVVGLMGGALRGFDWLIKGQSLEVLLRPAFMSMMLLAGYIGAGELSPTFAVAANMASLAVTAAIGLVWLRAAMPRQQAAPFRSAELRIWLRAALPLALIELLRQLDGVYGVLILGAVATAEEAGIFRVAASSVVIIAIPSAVMHVVMAPTLARLYAAGAFGQLRLALTHSARMMVAGLVAGTVIVAGAGPWLVTLLFGEEYGGSWRPLVILAAAQILTAFFGVGGLLLAMIGHEKALAKTFAASLIVSVTTAIPLAKLWGGSGVALSAMIGFLAGSTLCWIYVRTTTGLDCSALGLAPARPEPA